MKNNLLNILLRAENQKFKASFVQDNYCFVVPNSAIIAVKKDNLLVKKLKTKETSFLQDQENFHFMWFSIFAQEIKKTSKAERIETKTFIPRLKELIEFDNEEEKFSVFYGETFMNRHAFYKRDVRIIIEIAEATKAKAILLRRERRRNLAYILSFEGETEVHLLIKKA